MTVQLFTSSPEPVAGVSIQDSKGCKEKLQTLLRSMPLRISKKEAPNTKVVNLEDLLGTHLQSVAARYREVLGAQLEAALSNGSRKHLLSLECWLASYIRL